MKRKKKILTQEIEASSVKHRPPKSVRECSALIKSLRGIQIHNYSEGDFYETKTKETCVRAHLKI